MALSASRIAPRSTTQGTPVKSCSSTRAGRKLISMAFFAASHLATYSMSLALTVLSSSNRSMFFEQDSNGIWDAGQAGNAFLFERFETEYAIFAIAHTENGRGAEGVLIFHVVNFSLAYDQGPRMNANEHG